MAFAYTTNLQASISYAVWNVAYATLSAPQKVQLDGTWASGSLTAGAAYNAYIEVAQLAQWYEQAASTPDLSFPEPAWDRLFIAKAAMILAKTVRPDRLQQFQADHETALDEAVDTFTRDLVGSTSLAGQSISLAGIRAFVIDHCVKRVSSGTGLRRRLFPPIAQIDAHLQWVLNMVWNSTPWHFRKRQVTLRFTTSNITSATWNESTKTLTCAGAFSDPGVSGGNRLMIVSGTGVVADEYTIANAGDFDSIVLDKSLSSAGTNLTTGDITGYLQIVSLTGMDAGEGFDSVASRKFFYDSTFYGNTLEWADATDMARCKAYDGTVRARPVKFRTEKYGASTVWHLSPFPDTSYTLKGAVCVSGIAALTTAATLTTAMARFPADFGPVIRDIVLARVLDGFNASDGKVMLRNAMDQMQTLLPNYSDQGAPTKVTSLEDVYNDYGAMQRDRGYY